MTDQYNDLSIIQLRAMVTGELHWIRKKVETLERKECLILLNNKEKFIRKEIYCNCCGNLTKIEDMRILHGKVMKKCRECHVKERNVNLEYDDYEFQVLNDIEIKDDIFDREDIKAGVKHKINLLLDKFINKVALSNPPPPTDNIIKTFFKSYLFEEENFEKPMIFSKDAGGEKAIFEQQDELFRFLFLAR